MCLLPSSGIFFRDELKIALAFSAWDFSNPAWEFRQFCIFKIKIKGGMPLLDHIPFSSLICSVQDHGSYFKARDGVHRKVTGLRTQWNIVGFFCFVPYVSGWKTSQGICACWASKMTPDLGLFTLKVLKLLPEKKIKNPSTIQWIQLSEIYRINNNELTHQIRVSIFPNNLGYGRLSFLFKIECVFVHGPSEYRGCGSSGAEIIDSCGQPSAGNYIQQEESAHLPIH